MLLPSFGANRSLVINELLLGKPGRKFWLCLLLYYATLGKFFDGFGPSYLHFSINVKIPVAYKLMKTKGVNIPEVLSMIPEHTESI